MPSYILGSKAHDGGRIASGWLPPSITSRTRLGRRGLGGRVLCAGGDAKASRWRSRHSRRCGRGATYGPTREAGHGDGSPRWRRRTLWSGIQPARTAPVALTFDDGPGVYTRLAVRKLRAYHLLATFFLVGKEIRAWPGLADLEKPVAVFGDHTMTHPFLPALPRMAMVHEIRAAHAVIAAATQEPVVLFRPPYEGRTPAIDAEVRALGMLEVLWNVDSHDSLGANYAGIERSVIAGLRPGSIVLMHENRGQTIRALPTIFRAIRRDHLQAVTVPELVAEDPPSLAQLHTGVGGCSVVRRSGNGS